MSYLVKTGILAVTLTYYHAAAQRFYAFKRLGTGMRYTKPAIQHHGISHVQCIQLCQSSVEFRSASYHPETGRCEVNTAYPSDGSVPGTLSPGWFTFYPSEDDLMDGANAWLSSTYCPNATACGNASKAIDGNINGDFNQGSCAQAELGPSYLIVELRTHALVHRVVIYFRTDCCFDKLRMVLIRIKETIDDVGKICQFYNGPPSSVAEQPVTIICSDPVYGKYVQIAVIDPTPLTICEVEVFAY